MAEDTTIIDEKPQADSEQVSERAETSTESVDLLEPSEPEAPSPNFALDYDGDKWLCPVTAAGPVPKTLSANLYYRKNLLSAAENDPTLQADLRSVCAQSPLYFLNVYGWCYRPKMICEDGIERSALTTWTDNDDRVHVVPPADQPVITWPSQDAFVTELVKSMREGGLVLAPKSRDQGATLLVMGICCWGLLFWPRFSALCISRREDLVDNQTEDSLFGKVDYMVSKLPAWMVAPDQIKRSSKPIRAVNPVMGSHLLGESANVDVGQSHRVTVAVVDEAARFPHGGKLMKSIQSVGACTVLTSTPNGPGTEFSKLCIKAETPEGRKRIKLITLSYADSPTHGRGREWTIDRDGSVTGHVGGGFWETEAFYLSRVSSANAKDWRENWLIDHETSGAVVLNSSAISRLRRHVETPRVGKIVEGKFVELENGRLYLWEKPKPYTTYVMGGDFSQGVEASNTVLAVMDRSNGRIVAEYVDPSIDAFEAAPIAIELGKFYGGDADNAFLIWENNGPGVGFGKEIVKAHYFPRYEQRDEQARDQRTSQWGWTSTPARKEIAFSQLNKALCSNKFTTYSEAGLDDMAAWIYDDFGRIVCGSRRDETTGAQTRHGDRCIAYMLCVKGADYMWEYTPPVPDGTFKPGTNGWQLNHQDVWESTTGTLNDLAEWQLKIDRVRAGRR